MSRACSFTYCLPPHPARSPHGYRGIGDDLAMVREDDMSWLQEESRGRFQLRDYVDGPARPERDRAAGILVIENVMGEPTKMTHRACSVWPGPRRS
jgi:hypothetical protein